MSYQIATLFQSADDPDLTADKLIAQICRDWSGVLTTDASEIRADNDAVDGKILTVRIGAKRVGVFQMAGPFEFDISAIVEMSRLLPTGPPNTDGPYFVVSVVPDDDVINALSEDEFVEQSDATSGNEVDDALLISYVIASLISCTHTIEAVLFHAGTNLVSANIVRETTIDFAPMLPVLLWAEFGVGPSPDASNPDGPDKFGGFTSGLDGLGLRDILVAESDLDGKGTVDLLIGVALKQCTDREPIAEGMLLETETGMYSVGLGSDPDEPERPDFAVLTQVR